MNGWGFPVHASPEQAIYFVAIAVLYPLTTKHLQCSFVFQFGRYTKCDMKAKMAIGGFISQGYSDFGEPGV